MILVVRGGSGLHGKSLEPRWLRSMGDSVSLKLISGSD